MRADQHGNHDVRAFVSEYYGKILQASADLKTNACCAGGAPAAWIAERLQHVHENVLNRFYGCGFPIPHALDGATVLDLGCGTGRDAFVLAQLVGEQGQVHGIDMTEEQLAVARATVDWHTERFRFKAPNTHFHQGYIEDLAGTGIDTGTVDVVVSNCVINLSPRKDLVLGEAHRVLRKGGELYVSDVLVDRRLPETLSRDPLLHAECLGGALYQGDFVRLAKVAGFADPRLVTQSPITIGNRQLALKIGAARFYSATYRLFKLDSLDAECEDYGQSAIYRGGIEGAEAVFWLDDHHAFEVGRPERICANTAAMLSETRFARWFDVVGSKTTHFGLFPCGPTHAAASYASNNKTDAACC